MSDTPSRNIVKNRALDNAEEATGRRYADPSVKAVCGLCGRHGVEAHMVARSDGSRTCAGDGVDCLKLHNRKYESGRLMGSRYRQDVGGQVAPEYLATVKEWADGNSYWQGWLSSLED